MSSTAGSLRRRLVTVPAMLGATVVATVGLPVIVPSLMVVDLLADRGRGRLRLPRLRVYLFGLQYLLNDSAEILLAPLYWLLAGAGTRLSSAASIERHRRVQWWSLELLARRAGSLLGLHVEIDGGVGAALRPGPVVVISRHASLFDASLPGLVCGREGLAVRGVVTAEMLADPGFDLLYGRLGSVFIHRDDGHAAREAIGAMARSIARVDGEDVAVVIFPEGRLFEPRVRDRSLRRLAESDPDRAERLAGLRRLLPPRPTGLRILLETLPAADLVLLDHAGLDGLGRLRDLVDRIPVGRPVRVTGRRIPRAEIPGLGGGSAPGSDPGRDRGSGGEAGDEAAFAVWLDGLWLDLDRS